MITSELLAAVKDEFPDLTDKTLRDWVKDGFLQPPERVGMGTDGTPNEWAPESVHRIKIIKSVTNKRVDKSRARKALIAAGFFIGAQALRDELIKRVDEIIEVYSPTQPDDNGVRIVVKSKHIIDKNLATIIKTALLAPTAMIDDAISNKSLWSHQFKLLSIFSFTHLKTILNNATDTQLFDAFNAARYLFNMVTPIIGWLRGYDNYPPIDDASVLMQHIRRREVASQLDKYEFEYVMRILCVAGCLLYTSHKSEIKGLLPKVLTKATLAANSSVKPDEFDDEYLTLGAIEYASDKSVCRKLLAEEHAETVTFTHSLLK